MHASMSTGQVRALATSPCLPASPSHMHSRKLNIANVATMEAPTLADYAAVLHQVLPQKSRVQEPVIYKPTGPRLPLPNPEMDGAEMGDKPSSVRGQRFAKRRLRSHVPYSDVASNPQPLSREQEMQCCAAIQAAQALEQLVASRSTIRRSPALQQQYQQRQKEAAKAVQLLLQSCRKMITHQAHKLQYKVEPSRRVPYDDMFSAGVLGMLEAARKFHIQPAESMQGSTVVENSVRFSTFAHSYITKQMRQAMMNYDSNDIYIPRRLMDIRTKAARTISELKVQAAATGQAAQPTITSVARSMGTRPQAVADLVQAMTLRVTGFEESGDDEDEGGLKAVWRMQPTDNSNNSDTSQLLKVTFDVTEELDWQLRRQSLQDQLSVILRANEVDVLLKSVGLSVSQDGTSTGPMTQKQIADEMGVSRQFVDQLQKRAVRKLQEACEHNAVLIEELQELCDLM